MFSCYELLKTTYLSCKNVIDFMKSINLYDKLAATLGWFTAGGAIRIAVRQLLQTWKLRHYDVIDDVISRKL